VEALDDAALGSAGKKWLVAELDDLARELEQIRERVRRATKASDSRRPLRVARERGSATAKSRTPAALKARAVGR
jgi:hypothetical protein